MDGIEATRQIRKRVGNDVTIIVLTSYDYSEIEEEARAAGVDAFITKPLFRSRLEALDKIEANPEDWYNLVFMDIQMPVMNGHIAKPLDFGALSKVLKKYLS